MGRAERAANMRRADRMDWGSDPGAAEARANATTEGWTGAVTEAWAVSDAHAPGARPGMPTCGRAAGRRRRVQGRGQKDRRRDADRRHRPR